MSQNKLQLYKFIKDDITLTYSQEENEEVSQMIALDNSQVLVYFTNGNYLIWDVSQALVTKEGQISDSITGLIPINGYQLAYIDLQEKSKLEVLDLQLNDNNRKYSMDLPTIVAFNHKERKQDPTVGQLIVEYQTQLVTLPLSNMLVIFEEKCSTSNEYEYVITVLKEDHLPNTFSQFTYKAGTNKCNIKNVNKKDTIVVYPSNVSDQPLKFLVWNILMQEKGCSELQFKDQINASIVSISSWGPNKIAFWINPTFGGKPEIKIMDTKTQGEFKGIIDCYENEDWILNDMVHIDTERNYAMIKKIGEQQNSLDIIYLGKFKKAHSEILESQDYCTDNILSFSLDSKFFIQYQENIFTDKQLINNQVQSATKSTTQSFLKINFKVGTFQLIKENYKIKTLDLLVQKDIMSLYGEKTTFKILECLFNPEDNKNYDTPLKNSTLKTISTSQESQEQNKIQLKKQFSQSSIQNNSNNNNNSGSSSSKKKRKN